MPRRTSLIAAPLLAGAVLLVPASAALAAKTTKVTVMTRNLFLGADLIPLTAPKGPEFEKAAGATLAEIKAGKPKARMKLVAGEIAKAKPDLVGLQEVSIWRTGPKGDPARAKRVLVDYLKVITHELKRRHQPYRVVTTKQAFNVEGPTDRGVDVRLTLGDAVLARKAVKVRHARSGVFEHQLEITTDQLGKVNTHRSWNSFDAAVRGAHLRFVNAHLEAYSPDFRLLQAKELVAGPLKHRGTTILAGDLNSGPDLELAEDRPPYEAIADAGFKPERTKRDSCCFDDVTGAGKWDHNVDWIMARPKVGLVRSYVTGREHTKGGIFPSDHGGVVSVLRVKR